MSIQLNKTIDKHNFTDTANQGQLVKTDEGQRKRLDSLGREFFNPAFASLAPGNAVERGRSSLQMISTYRWLVFVKENLKLLGTNELSYTRRSIV